MSCKNTIHMEINNQVYVNTSSLFLQHCAFTGKLEKYTRREAMQLVADVGAITEDRVTQNTRFLIVGAPVRGAAKSQKHEKAEKLRQKGQRIEFIPETIFYEMLGEAGYGQILMDEWLRRCDDTLDDAATALQQFANDIQNAVKAFLEG